MTARFDAAELLARASAGADADGALQLRCLHTWEVFPVPSDGRTHPLTLTPETPRGGEDPVTCTACAKPDEAYLWTNELWRLTSKCGEASLPVFILESRGHYDFGDLPTDALADLGPTMQRIERAVASIEGIARVHLDRWGDGAVHFHLWFHARPAGIPQLKGIFLPTWQDALPIMPDELRVPIEEHVRAALA